MLLLVCIKHTYHQAHIWRCWKAIAPLVYALPFFSLSHRLSKTNSSDPFSSSWQAQSSFITPPGRSCWFETFSCPLPLDTVVYFPVTVLNNASFALPTPLFLQPLLDPSLPIHTYFPPRHLAIVLPALMFVSFIGFVTLYIGFTLFKSSKAKAKPKTE